MGLTTTQLTLLIGFAFLMSGGQLLFKFAALRTETVDGVAGFAQLLLNSYFVVAIVLYAGATFLWIYILQHVPLSRAYPFAALAFAIVPAFAATIFGDVITARYVAGLVLIIAGVYLAGLAPQ